MKPRMLTLEDYDEVYRLWLSTPNMGLNSVDDTREGIGRYLARNPSTCFVAEKSGRIVGGLSGHDGRRGTICHMAAMESEQRQGIGTALLQSAMNALEAEGISKVNLVVFCRNGKGNAFWESCGFTTRDDLTYRSRTLRELPASTPENFFGGGLCPPHGNKKAPGRFKGNRPGAFCAFVWPEGKNSRCVPGRNLRAHRMSRYFSSLQGAQDAK